MPDAPPPPPETYLLKFNLRGQRQRLAELAASKGYPSLAAFLRVLIAKQLGDDVDRLDKPLKTKKHGII